MLDLIFTPEDLIKLLLAIIVGGLIGFERELHSKAAGLRTITLICIGSTLFTILSVKFREDARVAANVVTGIGFLGAGAILLTEGKVKGLTTASSIWAAAALGMAIGLGEYLLAGIATIVVFVVLTIFTQIDRLLDRIGKETRIYEITYIDREGKSEELDAIFKAHRMRIRSRRRMRKDECLIGMWEVVGRVRNHLMMAETLLADKEIRELQY